MEIKEMDLEQVETRLAEVKDLLHTDGADLDALETEIRSLKERRAEINADIEKRKAEINDVINNGVEVETFEKEEVRKTMEIKELRNTQEYINAYAEYIKGNDKQVRQLITENAGETVTPPCYWKREAQDSLSAYSCLPYLLVSGGDGACAVMIS